MKKIFCLIIALFLVAPIPAVAENITVQGNMGSFIHYELREQITTMDGMRKLDLSFVIPQSFQSPTYQQSIKDVALIFSPDPQEKKKNTDRRGNEIVTATWAKVPKAVDVRLSFNASSQTKLDTIHTEAPFPLEKFDDRLAYYLKATELVQTNHPQIRDLAVRLTIDARTEFDAVQQIISWVVDHIQYVTPPVRYDALYALEAGKGNCQNYSHLSSAMLRAVGIPVRIVNGVTLNQSYDITWQNGVLTLKMGQGRHSWIEVWFPDLDWVPFDPQNTQLFVSNRFVRIEIGTDNQETKNDGLLRWTQTQDATGSPSLQETIHADFIKDNVKITGNRQTYGPKNFLLSPDVKAHFKQIEVKPTPPPPVIPEKVKKELVYDTPFVFGNLQFPEDVDFAFPRKTTASGKNQFEMTKNFLVETAEYVTTNVTQYAQIVILRKPLQLKKVGLALHNFGGEGWLWINIYQDHNGKPGEPLYTSDMVALDELSLKPGYRWQDFDFGRDNAVLMPGAYWIALGFTGSPIVNWFYTYGKPVGPTYGTRYKNVFQENWSGALNYEFNYRVVGLTVK
ncbi:MAG: transglutaminase domain-containing protein [Deltaproteobacteria bacterium]|nr:transglutaminase domain-containing protein [Deltaproteobacteria bacterium]